MPHFESRDKAREFLKTMTADYMNSTQRPTDKEISCIHPENHEGGVDARPSMGYNKKRKNACYCAACGKSYDIFDFIAIDQNMSDYNEQFNYACKLYNVTYDTDTTKRRTSKVKNHITAENAPEATETRPERTTEQDPISDYTEYYKACRARINDPTARRYLDSRGISPDTAARYWLGYDPAADPASAPGATGSEYKAHPAPRIIIPFDKGRYTGRRIDAISDYKYSNSKGGGITMFNTKALKESSGRPLFIVEGAFDALSVIEAGGDAIALNGTSNVTMLLELLRAEKTKRTLIISRDNDKPGQNAAIKLAAGLRELNIPYTTANIYEGCKDANEALTKNRAKLEQDIKAAERKAAKPDNTADYIMNELQAEINQRKGQNDRKTGFTELDAAAGGIYNGLYVIGGISSLGKTTLVHQIADQMAAAGNDVIFYSMEQSRLELVTKSISRVIAQLDPKTTITSLQIRNGLNNIIVERAIKEYQAGIGGHMNIIEGNFDCTVGAIWEYVEQYKQRNDKTPIVFIDYLQIIQAEKNEQTGRTPTDARAVVDANITKLKRMSRRLETPVFVISSLNRGNYLTPIDFESFKESGCIEFTADVIWGIQLKIMNDAIFDKATDIKKKREMVNKAKKEQPRKVELVCLKNRYGVCNYSVDFMYYPERDCFKSIPFTPYKE